MHLNEIRAWSLSMRTGGLSPSRIARDCCRTPCTMAISRVSRLRGFRDDECCRSSEAARRNADALLSRSERSLRAELRPGATPPPNTGASLPWWMFPFGSSPRWPRQHQVNTREHQAIRKLCYVRQTLMASLEIHASRWRQGCFFALAGAAIYVDAVSIPKAERDRLLEFLGLQRR